MKLKARAFTLIELLVVIAIMSLLASIIIGSVQQARAKSRDSKRVQDLVQLRNALELYKADNNGLYPADPNTPDNFGVSCWECNTVGPTGRDAAKLAALANFMSTRPSDPSFTGTLFLANNGYNYKVSGSRREYKLVIYGRVEDINNIPIIMRDNGTFGVNVNSAKIYSSDISRDWNRTDNVSAL